MGIIRSPLQTLRHLWYGPPPKPDTKAAEYSPLQLVRRESDVRALYEKATAVSYEREVRYRDYEEMILDSILAGAVQLVTDDATQYSRDRAATVWVNSTDIKTRTAIEEMFDNIHLEDRIFDWVYNACLYGDMFVQVIGEADAGILLVQDDIHPMDIQRIDVNGVNLGYRLPSNKSDESYLYDPWEFVHLNIQAAQRRRRQVENERLNPSSRSSDPAETYRLTTKYGVSVLEPVRRIYKQLSMIDQSLVIARLSRAMLKYLYKVQVGAGNTVKHGVQLAQEMKHLINSETGMQLGKSFEQQYSPLNGSEDIFLPVFGDQGDVSVETLGGDVDIHGIVDVERLTNKLFAGLNIPPAYLGFSDSLPGSLGQSMLVRMDIRYARMVKRIQRAFISAVTRLAQIHLAYKGIDPSVDRFSIEMDVISTAEEMERMDAMTSAIRVAGDTIDLIDKTQIVVPRKDLARIVMTDVVGASEEMMDLIAKSKEPTEVDEDGSLIGAIGGMRSEPPAPSVTGDLPVPKIEEPFEVVDETGGVIAPEEEGEGELPIPEESVKKKTKMSPKEVALESLQHSVKRSGDLAAELPTITDKEQAAEKKEKRRKSFASILEKAIDAEEKERASAKIKLDEMKNAKKVLDNDLVVIKNAAKKVLEQP